MNTWICRILAVLFFINTLPVEAFAKKKINAPRFNQEALTQKVENAVSEENKFKQEKAELEAYLAQKDLKEVLWVYLALHYLLEKLFLLFLALCLLYFLK